MVKRTVLTALVLTGVCLLARAAPEGPKPQAVKAFNEAAVHFNAQRYQASLDGFTRAVQADGNFAEAYYGRGMAYYHLKRTDQALQDLNQCTRLDPGHARASAGRGVLQYERGRMEEAGRDLDAALRLDPEDVQSYLARGMVRLKRGQREGALKDFRSFLKRRPNDPVAPQVRRVAAQLEQALAETPAASGTGPVREPAAREDHQAIEQFILNPEVARVPVPTRTLTGEVRPVTDVLEERQKKLLVPKKGAPYGSDD